MQNRVGWTIQLECGGALTFRYQDNDSSGHWYVYLFRSGHPRTSQHRTHSLERAKNHEKHPEGVAHFSSISVRGGTAIYISRGTINFVFALTIQPNNMVNENVVAEDEEQCLWDAPSAWPH